MLEEKIRILMADDHALFRAGIIGLIKEEKDIFIIGEAENGEDLITKYFNLKPSLALVDITMPELSGMEAAKKIIERDENAKIIFLSMHEEEQYIYYCLKIGGRGYMNKNISKGELIYAIRTVYEGGIYFGPKYDAAAIEDLKKRYNKKKVFINDYEHVTPKEAEILSYISEGLMSQEIADKLNCSKKTIDTHRQNIIDKFGLKSLPSLIKFAIEFTNTQKDILNK
jgi:DNA-binding NarL/FixJ family response regulator